jgi:crotonobetaine/carnitine-CoA ligase
LSERGFVSTFVRIAQTDPERTFCTFNGKTFDFGTIERHSAALATALQRIGLVAGDRVAVMLRNGPDALAAIFALARAGLVWVPLNVQHKGGSLRYVLAHSQPRCIIAETDLVQTIGDSGWQSVDMPLIPSRRPAGQLSLTSIFETVAPFERHVPDADEPFAIMYTSGTTGPPKGAIVTHAMLRLAGDAVALVSDARDGDVFFVWEPFYHIGGAQLIVLPLIRRVALAMVHRFSASGFWEQVRDSGATHIHYLGGILQILLRQPERSSDRAHTVRIAWGGGCSHEAWRPFEGRFGVQIRECYGMTEASSITTYNDNGTVGSVGRPVPWFDVEVQQSNGEMAAPHQVGEIVVRPKKAGAIFPGYFRNVEASQRALRDGALHTGDLGAFDADGNLFFHGRATDSVRCKGENVSAWEVESIAAAHPCIEDCAMIGVAADIGEQDIKLFIKPRNGTKTGPRELSRWLSQRLAPYQNPRYIAFVDRFERTPSQRIMKHTLSKRLDDCWDRLLDIDGA